MHISNRFGLWLWLAALAYLGFYVFGLIMGVYSPGLVPYLTVPAVLMVIAIGVALYGRKGSEDDVAIDEAENEARRLREQRGF